MKIERAILVAFIGNYLINTVITGLVSLIPASGGAGLFTPQYITFVIVAAVTVLLIALWYDAQGWKDGLAFGVIGFFTAVLTALVSGIAGVMAQTGSLSSVITILPNFGPFLATWSTLVLACYWIIPATAYGWFHNSRAPMTGGKPPMPHMGSFGAN